LRKRDSTIKAQRRPRLHATNGTRPTPTEKESEMTTKRVTLMQDAVAGAGALAAGAREGIKHAVAQYRSAHTRRRVRQVFKTVGVAAAVLGVAYGTFAAIRAVRNR
jgi:hypothetical protein